MLRFGQKQPWLVASERPQPTTTAERNASDGEPECGNISGVSDASGSLTQRIHLTLRRQIITGTLKPGQRLRERELADEMGVSRVPVREAIMLLVADGLAISQPRRMASVVELTLADVKEFFDVRLSLETQATRLAATRAAAGADTTALTVAIQRADEALDRGEHELVGELNAQVHEEIVALAGNQLLAMLMRPIMGRERLIFHLRQGRDESMSCREHRDIHDAIVKGQVERAGALDYAHVERARQDTVGYLSTVLDNT